MGLEFIETVGGTAKAPIHRYRFAAQETELRGDEPLHCPGGAKFGTVDSISLDDRTIDVKKRVDSAGLHPEAVFAHKIIGSKELANSLVRLGDYVAENGLTGNGPYQAGRDLLLREVPRIGGDAIRLEEEAALDAALRIAPKLTGGLLPIQGPPGTGKTFTGARMICALVKAGKRVGITANSHKVIRNLLDEVVRGADERGIDVQCIEKVTEAEDDVPRIAFTKYNAEVFEALNSTCQLAAGTKWLWAREEAFESVDVLFVDEAAQMSLADVLAVSQAALCIVLLGEAPISIYSMTTSTYADAPRGMEFLYSSNRLNVATSRAKCICIVVGSPALFEAECRTPRQMQLANAFCRYLELAQAIPIDSVI